MRKIMFFCTYNRFIDAKTVKIFTERGSRSLKIIFRKKYEEPYDALR